MAVEDEEILVSARRKTGPVNGAREKDGNDGKVRGTASFFLLGRLPTPVHSRDGERKARKRK